MLGKLLDRLFCLTGALICVQLPQFFTLYTQRLAGHLAELNRLINQWQRLAGSRSLSDYVHKFVAHQDVDVSQQGSLMQTLLQRQSQLSDALMQMQEATPLGRPWAFMRHLQPDIAQATWNDFRWGLNFSLEGLCYALIGLLIGYGLFTSCRYLVSSLVAFSFVRGR